MTPVLKQIKDVQVLLKHLQLKTRLLLISLLPYYVLTVAGTILEGTSLLLLVSWFTAASSKSSLEILPSVLSGILNQFLSNSQPFDRIWLVVFLLGLAVIVRSFLAVFDAIVNSVLRRKLQERVFTRYVIGNWKSIGTFRVGEAVGTTTTEAATVAKYLSSIVSVGFYFLSATAMTWLAVSVSLNLSLILIVIASPLMILIKIAITRQARLSRQIAILRNIFSSDITDRYNGLFQIHVDDRDEFHILKGTRIQSNLTKAEIKMSAYQAIIGSFGLLLPFTALLGFALWVTVVGIELAPTTAMIASVGVLGVKVAGQLNGLIASFGTMSRLSGSLHPVFESLSIPEKPLRREIPERVLEIDVEEVTFGYGDKPVLESVSLRVRKGFPLALSGRSGMGKTTLANLIGGLYFPLSGKVIYVGETGERYDSKAFKAKVGYVTQDIYIFRGTLRDSLTSGRICSDEQIWNTLETVEAADFVRALGGLDIESAEAGRDFSGGQRRRLGIARVLLTGADILIFDEVSSGLDQLNKAAVFAILECLSRSYLVILISHEEFSMSAKEVFTL
jgi:ATP-binding cassette subfamily B protein